MATSTPPTRPASGGPTRMPARSPDTPGCGETVRAPRRLGRSRLWQERRRRRFRAQGRREGGVPRLLERPADDVRRTREGIYNARIIGPPGMRVQVILLDVRWFRSPLKLTDQRDAPGKERYLPDADPAKTMLGDVQWAWLAARAAQARRGAADRVLASRCWPRAMAGSAGAISRSNARSCSTRSAPATPTASCSLSGDRHIGALYRETAGRPLPAARDDLERPEHGLLGGHRNPAPIAWARSMPRANFGAIDIDWWERKVTLALRDEGGSMRRSVTIEADDADPRQIASRLQRIVRRRDRNGPPVARAARPVAMSRLKPTPASRRRP